MTDILRCKHGHSSFTHPYCFVKQGKELVLKSSHQQKPLRQWWEDMKIGFFDIETNDLVADPNIGWMVCWAIKERGNKKVVTDHLTQEEVLAWKPDKRITKSLIAEMRKYDVLVTYNGILFDNKFVRTRAFNWKLDFPKWKELLHIDLYWKARTLFRLSHTTLKNVTKLLDIEGKTRLDFYYWKRASLGDPKCMKELLIHNREDVIILENAFEQLKDYCKFDKKPL